MKTALFLFLLSFSLHAHDVCHSNGVCQVDRELSIIPQCYIVKTGYDVSGKLTCAVRCVQVPRGYYCDFEEGKVYGYCKKEKLDRKFPEFDPNDPNKCDEAVDLYPEHKS